MSLLIVALHTNLFDSFHPLIDITFNGIIIRAGVPFCFISSSFFLFKKVLTTTKKPWLVIKKYIIRISSLYLAWAIINIPQIIDMHGDKTGVKFLRELLFGGIYRGSWYLTASIYSVLFVSFLVFVLKWHDATIFLVGFILYQIPIFTSFYPQVGDFLGISKLDLFFQHSYSPYVGIIFVIIGYLAAKYEKLMTPYLNYSIVILLFSFILSAVEVFLNYDNAELTDNYESLILFGTGVFLFTLSLSQVKKPHLFIIKSSTPIFLSQFVIIYFIEYIASRYNISISNITLFFLTTLFTLIISYILYWITNHKKQTVLKFLY